jgi:hypothetical protein
MNTANNKLNGGKLEGNHYYLADVVSPINPKVAPYTAECSDIIESLNMTFNEGECFKALWRLAASRQGRGKPGNEAKYDADKVAHYGNRVAVQNREEQVDLGSVVKKWGHATWETDVMDNRNE